MTTRQLNRACHAAAQIAERLVVIIGNRAAVGQAKSLVAADAHAV